MPRVKGPGKPQLSLPKTTVPSQPAAAGNPNDKLLVCSAPTSRTGPVFELSLRRPVLLKEAGDDEFAPLDLYLGLAKAVAVAGVAFSMRDVYFGLDARFRQTWNLTDLTIGDLASTMSLAPREQLTIEIQTSQRKVLDQSTLDSTEAMSTSESTASDKEAVNVARASSKTEGWHVDATGTVSCGYASATVGVGYSQSVTESNQQTVNHVTEATRKSAKNLKTLHKIDVRGVSESLVQNRMTRVLKNPYYDRALSINVFQLLKHFSVETDLVDLRGAMIFRIDTLVFDNSFVLNHVDFLRNTLLDPALIDDLPSAIQGAKPTIQSGARDTALVLSKLALRYLFNLDAAETWTPTAANIMDLAKQDDQNDQNDPQQSFQLHKAVAATDDLGGSGMSAGDVLLGIATGGASLLTEATAQAAIDVYKQFNAKEAKIMWSAGFDTAVRTKASAIFATLAYFNGIVHESVPDPNDPNSGKVVNILQADNNAISLATALAAELQLQWDKLYPDPLKSDELHAMMSSRNFTEVFRRVPGFIAMIRESVRPLVEPAGADSQAITAHNQDVFTLNRIIEHLKDYSTFYTERFLQYISQATNNVAIVEFATKAFSKDTLTFSFLFDVGDFDFDRAFLIRRDIVIPGWAPLDDTALSGVAKALGGQAAKVSAPVPTVEDIELPCDGVHFEVATGACLLQNVPTEPEFPAALKGLTIGLT